MLNEKNGTAELCDSDVEQAVGGKADQVEAASVKSCPYCGRSAEQLPVADAKSMKYRCPCGKILTYSKTANNFI